MTILGIIVVMVAFIMIRKSEPTWFIASVGKIPYFDKIGHFFVMGLISLCAVAGFSHRLSCSPTRASFLVMACVFFISTLEEISQAFMPSRTFSLADLSFSALGIICLGLVGHWISRQRD